MEILTRAILQVEAVVFLFVCFLFFLISMSFSVNLLLHIINLELSQGFSLEFHLADTLGFDVPRIPVPSCQHPKVPLPECALWDVTLHFPPAPTTKSDGGDGDLWLNRFNLEFPKTMFFPEHVSGLPVS